MGQMPAHRCKGELIHEGSALYRPRQEPAIFINDELFGKTKFLPDRVKGDVIQFEFLLQRCIRPPAFVPP